ncbi:MAG: 7-carboxy-7-deazaguanine synthase QueE [Pseudomonadales bacterium]
MPASASASIGSNVDAATISLRITEIFTSLQGEARSAGYPTTFVRLTGCPLRCQYCDTAYAFSGGEMRSGTDIVAAVTAAAVPHVTVTGGEPMAQADVLPLMVALCDAGFDVSLETSGALDVSAVDPRVSRVLDIKTPDSGEVTRNLWSNLEHCGAHDQVKFVLCSRSDYDWARMKCDEHQLDQRFGEVWFSPSADQLDPRALADWMVADRCRARLQVQLHKMLWGDEPGR